MLLPAYGKLFERLIFNQLFSHLYDKKLLSTHQSGFCGNGSCLNWLLKLFNEIYLAFQVNPTLETYGELLKISKTFDKIWHRRLIYELNSDGVSGDLL